MSGSTSTNPRINGRQRPFVDSGFFALRTPLLPMQEFLTWSSELQAPSAFSKTDRLARDREERDAAVKTDRQRLREKLARLLEDPVISEAVFIASPDLTEAIEAWKSDPDSEKGRRAEEALVRYFTRMCCRCTPFGIFAGCSVGRIGESAHLELGARESYRRHARLDSDYLTSLTDTLSQDEGVRREVQLRPNPTLYRLGGRLRYAESRPTDRGRSHHLVAVTSTPHLEEILNDPGAVHRFDDLVRRVSSNGGAPKSEGAAFINTLIDNQALLPDLAPPITGPEPIHALIESCGSLEATRKVAQVLGRAREKFEAIEHSKLGIETDRYLAIAEDLEDLPVEPKLSRLFQVDLRKPIVRAELNDEVIEAALRGVEVLYFMAPTAGQDEVFRYFIEEFVKRYESQEIPLVEALDEENGIGFSKSAAPGAEPAPLLEDVVFATPGPDRTAWGIRERALLQMILDAQDRGDQEVELNPHVLAALASVPRLPLPDALCTMFVLVAESRQALAEGKFELLLNAATGPSGANLLGRFCHSDPELTRAVQDHITSEEELDPEAIFAEVVHLPEGRLGNILLRPQLREHCISLLGTASQPEEQEIPITDLMVSVREGRVVLRSKRLGKRIRPRMTTAHGYMTESNLGIYKFLCSLQWQGTSAALKWDWAPFHTAKFLPRLRFGKVVVSRAQWLIEGTELQDALKAEDGQRFAEMQRLREKRRLPSLFVLADMDNELLVDLDNILSIDAFLAVVKKRPYFIVKELFPDPDKLCVRGPEGAFASEIIIPFVRRPGTLPAQPALIATAPPSAVTRIFPPGSEWLYSKLYTGTSTADWVLRDVVAPLVAELEAQGIIDRWFFIRYADPDFHIRLRFHGDRDAMMREVFPRLTLAIEERFKTREVWKLQLDCYQPEVERYGGAAGIELAEELFQADSEMVLDVLGRIWGEALADARGLLAVRGIDVLLDDFGYDLKDKRRLLEAVSESFAREFHFKDTPLRHQISKKFRAQRRDLEQLLAPIETPRHPLAPLFDVFEKRSRRWRPAIAKLRERAEQLVVPLDSVVISVIHMMANRLLRSANRPQELLIYSFLFRLYDSRFARWRKNARRKQG